MQHGRFDFSATVGLGTARHDKGLVWPRARTVQATNNAFPRLDSLLVYPGYIHIVVAISRAAFACSDLHIYLWLTQSFLKHLVTSNSP